jgi:hypothetical protein
MEKLDEGIKNLTKIFYDEIEEEQRKHTFGAWVASFIWKEVDETEEERERKDRRKQERRIERDLKERKSASLKGDLGIENFLLQKEQTKFHAANRDDERKIRDIRARIQLREDRNWWERQRKEQLERDRLEKIERERLAKLRKQREEEEARRREEEAKNWQEHMNTMREQREKERVAKEKRRAEDIKHREKMYANSRPQSYGRDDDGYNAPFCSHDEWWPKVQGRAACPECSDVWTYLLQCPGCAKKACPKCQAVLRPRRRRY